MTLLIRIITGYGLVELLLLEGKDSITLILENLGICRRTLEIPAGSCKTSTLGSLVLGRLAVQFQCCLCSIGPQTIGFINIHTLIITWVRGEIGK